VAEVGFVVRVWQTLLPTIRLQPLRSHKLFIQQAYHYMFFHIHLNCSQSNPEIVSNCLKIAHELRVAPHASRYSHIKDDHYTPRHQHHWLHRANAIVSTSRSIVIRSAEMMFCFARVHEMHPAVHTQSRSLRQGIASQSRPSPKYLAKLASRLHHQALHSLSDSRSSSIHMTDFHAVGILLSLCKCYDHSSTGARFGVSLLRPGV